MIWFSSDPHFGHKNIIKYSNRPFSNEDEMDEALIKNWNTKVDPGDTVYVLGDLSFRDAQRTTNILYRLNGDIKFCWGNHDKVVKNSPTLIQRRFSEVRDYYELKFKQTDGTDNIIVMSHYPMVVWNKAHRGSWMLHGHSHGNLKYPMKAKIMDVGVDPQNYFPISIVDVEKKMLSITPDVLDHHGRD